MTWTMPTCRASPATNCSSTPTTSPPSVARTRRDSGDSEAVDAPRVSNICVVSIEARKSTITPPVATPHIRPRRARRGRSSRVASRSRRFSWNDRSRSMGRESKVKSDRYAGAALPGSLTQSWRDLRIPPALDACRKFTYIHRSGGGEVSRFRVLITITILHFGSRLRPLFFL